MRISDTSVLPNDRHCDPDLAERAQRKLLIEECRDAIALLQALTEKAQREVFCKGTLAQMHGEILQLRGALARLEKL